MIGIVQLERYTNCHSRLIRSIPLLAVLAACTVPIAKLFILHAELNTKSEEQ